MLKAVKIIAIIIVYLLTIFIFVPARAEESVDQLMKADLGVEHTRGANNSVTALGNGRLTVGVSAWSELAYLRWPSVSRYEQLRYVTMAYGPFRDRKKEHDVRYGVDAPGPDWARYARPIERYPGTGARGGLYFNDGSLSWLGDPSWTSRRGYKPEEGSVLGPILCTELTRAAGKAAKIEVCQWVDLSYDLLIQEFTIDAPEASTFFYAATLAANDRLSTYSGNPDVRGAGFANVYLPDDGVILSFRPRSKEAAVPRFRDGVTAEALDALYPEGGVFVALALAGPADGYQIGADAHGRRAPLGAPAGASEQARTGSLGGSRFSSGPGDLGLERKLDHGRGEVVVLIAAAKSATAAIKIIKDARTPNAKISRWFMEQDLMRTASDIKLPPAASEAEARVARRSIMNLLFIGRDRDTGAIIASPSRQPAYHFDWPRDGAFFDLTLDLAGFPEIAGQHLEFYRATQRREPLDFHFMWLLAGRSPFYSPRGHWRPHMYTDGDKGRMWNVSFEIDETALLVWDLWRHEQFLPEAERDRYRQQNLEMLTLAADGLIKYVDLKKGWTKKAIEDDKDIAQATLHGAASVLTGLAAAVDAGRRWGADPKKLENWRRAALSLREGILRRIEDDSMLDRGGWRGMQWSLFPAPVFESYDDPRAQKLLARLAKDIEEKVSKKRPGFAYLGEQAFILGIAAQTRPEYRPLVRRAIDLLVNEVPVPGTDAYGEVTVWLHLPGEPDPVSLQRTSVPHLWTGVTAYLAIEACYRPERFLSQIPPPPK
jgi:hypothetical protein